ncbi:thioredoxin [uncultured Enterovirga sp.]|uniref:thioredoxin n=1 Tax=uncultured Enterovirga sp. TaxID=2026352 RepID=UPI0035CAD131
MLAATAAPPPDGLIKDTTTAAFRQDVIAESMKQPVLVDFWAPWCGPCKQLTPVIEKAVRAAGGKVKLVKMNIDQHPQIAGQLGVQSIPAVYAFDQGQPVDGFMGALPESQVQAFIDRVAGPGVAANAGAELLAEAAALAEAGDAPGAAELYGAVLAEEPDNVAAIAALAKLHLDLGDVEGARRVADMAPPAAKDPALAGIRAAIELAEQAASLGDLGDLERKVAADPDDHQARFDLALGLNGRNDREAAADQLLTIVRKDRTWQEDGARKQLVQFFEAWGPMDPATIAGRKRLSSILFA